MIRVTRNRYEVRYNDPDLSLSFPYLYAKSEAGVLAWVRRTFPSIDTERVRVDLASRSLKVSQTLVCDPDPPPQAVGTKRKRKRTPAKRTSPRKKARTTRRAK